MFHWQLVFEDRRVFARGRIVAEDLAYFVLKWLDGFVPSSYLLSGYVLKKRVERLADIRR